MQDILDEQLLSMSEAARVLPGRPNVATLWRWRTVGCRRIKLRTVLVGGRRRVSRRMLAEFISATTAAADGEPIRTETPRQRERAIQRAEQRAKDLGVRRFFTTGLAGVEKKPAACHRVGPKKGTTCTIHEPPKATKLRHVEGRSRCGLQRHLQRILKRCSRRLIRSPALGAVTWKADVPPTAWSARSPR